MIGYKHNMDDKKLSNPQTTIRLYSVHLKNTIDLKEFVLTHKNCKINNSKKWRCTYCTNDYILNLYKHGKFILFTKVLSESEIRSEIRLLFNCEPIKVILRNWSVKVKFPSLINLDNLKQKLSSSNLSSACNIIYRKRFLKDKEATAPEKVVQLNKQLFTAIIFRPFKGYNNITMSIFASGCIGITGLKKKSDLDLTINYINTNLIKILDKSSASLALSDEKFGEESQSTNLFTL